MAATMAGAADDDFDPERERDALGAIFEGALLGWADLYGKDVPLTGNADLVLHPDVAWAPNFMQRLGRERRIGHLSDPSLRALAKATAFANVTPIRKNVETARVVLQPGPANLLEYFSRLASTKEDLRHVLLTIAGSLGILVALALSPLAIAAAVVGDTTVMGWFGAVASGITALAGSIVGIRRLLARRRGNNNEASNTAGDEDEATA